MSEISDTQDYFKQLVISKIHQCLNVIALQTLIVLLVNFPARGLT